MSDATTLAAEHAEAAGAAASVATRDLHLRTVAMLRALQEHIDHIERRLTDTGDAARALALAASARADLAIMRAERDAARRRADAAEDELEELMMQAQAATALCPA